MKTFTASLLSASYTNEARTHLNLKLRREPELGTRVTDQNRVRDVQAKKYPDIVQTVATEVIRCTYEKLSRLPKRMLVQLDARGTIQSIEAA